MIGTVFAIEWLIPSGGVQVPDIITGKVITYQSWGVTLAVVGGLVAGIAIGFITEYYTATFKRPVQSIVDAVTDRSGDHIIAGIASG